MSKELQEQAERMMRELMDSLIPLKEEIRNLRGVKDENENRSTR